MEWDSIRGESCDSLLGDSHTFVVDGDIVDDFIHSLPICIRCPGFEYLGHGKFSFEEPTHSPIKISFGKYKSIRSVDRGDHG